MPIAIEIPVNPRQLRFPPRPIACFLAICLGFAVLAASVEARTIKNTELNYTLVVPDRLAQFKQSATQLGIVDAFATSDPAQGIPDAVVTISRLHVVLGRRHLDPSKTPIPGVLDARIRQQKWKTFDIDVIEGHVSSGGIRMSVRGAHIPLKREAIQLSILVPVGKEAEAEALLNELLAGLDGPSNWLTDEEWSETVGQLVVYIVALAIALFLGLRAWRNRSHRAPN